MDAVQEVSSALTRHKVDRLAIVIVAIGLVVTVLALVDLMRGGPYGIFAGPVALQFGLVVAAEASRLGRRGRPPFVIDGFRIFLILEMVRGVVVPVLTQYFGQATPVWGALGTPEAAATVLLVGNLFFGTFVAGHTFFVRVGPLRSRSTDVVTAAPRRDTELVALVAVALGLMGVALRFPTPTSFIEFLTFSSVTQEPLGGALGLLATILRPLLPLGLAALLVVHRGARRRVVIPLALALALSLWVAVASYNLNRSVLLMPALAFLTVCIGYLGLTLRARRAAVLVGVATVAFIAIGAMRNFLNGAAGFVEAGGGIVANAIQTLLIYGQSPLQAAVVLEGDNADHFSPATLANSLAFPVPGIPTWVRESSGAMQYNVVLYGADSVNRDQIIPSWFEAFVSIGWVGPVLLGVVLAVLLRMTDRAFQRSRSLFAAFASSLTGIWIAQLSINSFSTVGQGLLFFCVPPALLAAGAALVIRRRTARPDA